MIFKGAMTAMVTPFRNGMVDEEAFRQQIEWQIEQGIDGLVPCGTTGESATLSHAEHHEVIKICVDQVKGRVPVLAGAGSNNTKEAVELARGAKEAGADGALLITPYYNKPTQDGLYAHFKAIAEAVPFPYVLYNVPGRTSVNLLPATLGRIVADLPTVVGVKEATGDIYQASQVLECCGRSFQLLSGDDFTVLPLLSVGGIGAISVVSNVAPRLMHDMIAAHATGDATTAMDLHYTMLPLARAMFLETNPVPAKTALHLMGQLDHLELRLPMVPLQPANLDKLKATLSQAGLL